MNKFIFCLINIPWAIFAFILFICIGYIWITNDIKGVNIFTEKLNNGNYTDKEKINMFKGFVRRYPFSIIESSFRVYIMPASISLYDQKKRITNIKKIWISDVHESQLDLLIYCCFLFKENKLDDEYKLLVSKIIKYKKNCFLKEKLKNLQMYVCDETIKSVDSPDLLLGIRYYNSAMKIKNKDATTANKYFAECYKNCPLSSTKELIIKQGGTIE